MHVFLLLSWRGHFGANWPMSTLNHLPCRKYSFQNVTWFSQGNNVAYAAVSHLDSLFGEIHVFLQLGWIGLLVGHWNYHHCKYLSCRKYSFPNVNQFSRGRNVRNSVASNIDGFLGEIHVFLQLSLKCLCGAKGAYLHLENCDVQEVFTIKTNSTVTWKQYSRCYCF